MQLRRTGARRKRNTQWRSFPSLLLLWEMMRCRRPPISISPPIIPDRIMRQQRVPWIRRSMILVTVRRWRTIPREMHQRREIPLPRHRFPPVQARGAAAAVKAAAAAKAAVEVRAAREAVKVKAAAEPAVGAAVEMAAAAETEAAAEVAAEPAVAGITAAMSDRKVRRRRMNPLQYRMASWEMMRI